MEGRYALSIFFADSKSAAHYIIAPLPDGCVMILDSPDSKYYSSLTALITETPMLKNHKPIGLVQ